MGVIVVLMDAVFIFRLPHWTTIPARCQNLFSDNSVWKNPTGRFARGICGSSPPPTKSVQCDINLLRLCLFSLGQRESEDAIRVGGFHLVCGNRYGQCDGSLEMSTESFHAMHGRVLVACLGLPLSSRTSSVGDHVSRASSARGASNSRSSSALKLLNGENLCHAMTAGR